MVQAQNPAVSAEEFVRLLKQMLDALVERRTALTAEIADIDRSIESLRRTFVSSSGGPANVIVTGNQPAASGGVQATVIRKDSIIKPTVISVLKENGGVMHANEILEEVKKRGIPLSARDPKATIVTALIRMKNQGVVQALGENRWRWSADEAVRDHELRQQYEASLEANEGD